MRIFTLMIVTSAGIPLLAGCSLGQQLLSNPFVSGTPLPDQRSINPAVQVSGAAQAAMRTDRFDAARKLAWEAAVLVQSPLIQQLPGKKRG